MLLQRVASSIFLHTAVALVCGLGKSRLISDTYPEQFVLKLSPFVGLKTRKIPSPQTTDSAAFLIGTEEKEWAYRAVPTCFELHFYVSANEERSSRRTHRQQPS